MSDELSVTNGKVEMMYAGDVPWHGLGQQITDPATFAEGMAATGMDYRVVSESVYDQNGIEIEGHQIIRREDTGEIFRILSERYEIVQNVEAWGFMDNVLGSGQAVYHTAGALRGGRIMWVLAKRPGVAEIVPGDELEKYLLLTTSHDGSKALSLHTTPIRVVCGNTMRAALSTGRNAISIKHTSDIHNRIEKAEQALLSGDAYFRDMVNASKELAQSPMKESSFNLFIEELLNPTHKPAPVSTAPTYMDGVADRLRELFYTGRGQDNPKVRGTAWAAYNAVTEYVDYYSHVQKIGTEPQSGLVAQDRRLERSWYGRGQDTRNEAFNLLLNYRNNGDHGLINPKKAVLA